MTWLLRVLVLVPLLCMSSRASATAEDDIAATTVVVTSRLDGDCSAADKCETGAGVILAIDASGRPLVYTAYHLIVTEDNKARGQIEVSLRSQRQQPFAAELLKGDARLDIAVLRLLSLPASTEFTCRGIARVAELTQQDELVTVGAYWTWSRLNRFNRADSDYVYMETPVDRDGFSGGPVYVRGTLDLIGIYQKGNQGIVQVLRLDALPESLQPQTLAPPAPVERGDIVRHLGCETKSGKFLRVEESSLRVGVGVAQNDAAMNQLISPLLSGEAASTLSLWGNRTFAIWMRVSLRLGVSYFDDVGAGRVFFGQALYQMGPRLSLGPSFIDLMWTPGAYLVGKNLSTTGRSFSMAIGRRLGEDVAGVMASYLQRSNHPSIVSFQIFSDFALSSGASRDMPGAVVASTGDPTIDKLLAKEREDSSFSYGLLATTASDERWGLGGGVGGFQFAIGMAPFVVKRSGSLVMREHLDFLFGSVRLQERNAFYFTYAAELGLRGRLGLPHSLILDAFYYSPLVSYYERLRFPLVGVGAGIGYQYKDFTATFSYRYQVTKVLYDDQPNLSFVGLNGQFHPE